TGGTGRVALAWNSLPNATSYNVKRAGSTGGPYTTIAPGVTDVAYVDTAVQNGTTYFYIVDANVSGGSTSNPSSPASATTAPSAPTLAVSLYAETAANPPWTLS